ncbi:2-aminoadipate transaminase [Planomicrobium sp. HSC-17F08]|nr:2-aminoadipate transaminase [Planomicrobium sp. HSC-17F08]
MKQNFPFSKDIKLAFQNEPPGQWMTVVPPGCIRLNSGYPEPVLVPSKEIKEAVGRLLDEEQDLPLHYIGSPRIPELRKFIQQRMQKRDVVLSEKELLVTSGACQAIDLISRVLLDDEAVVAIEAPTYMEALEVFGNYTEHFMDVPTDANGLDTDRFEKMLAEREERGQTLPRLLYTIPTFQNPTGTTMTPERRAHVLELAKRYGFLILEDDAYGELAFGEQPQLLKAMDLDNRVLYVGSLSKVVAPGMRIGWVAGAEELVTVMEWFKKDLHHPFAQATMASYLEGIDFDSHLQELQDAYERKSSVMVAALEEFLPKSVSWYTPGGGYFIWVQVPGVDTARMLPEAIAAGVAYVPGRYFFLQQEEGREFLRLSFSYADEEQIVKGIELLGQVIGRTIPQENN